MAGHRDVVVGVFDDDVTAALAGLHLDDAGIAYLVRPADGRFELVVGADDALMARMVAHGGGVWADDEDDPQQARPHRRPVALLVAAALVVPLVVVALRLW